jgi:glyoxalase family protein
LHAKLRALNVTHGKKEIMSQPLQPIVGLHHVTAIASDPQRNLDFYTQVLGLRLVKRTINFDDPGTYHLYFGDDAGSPGTILTFFPWPHATRGVRGTGEATATSFSVAPDSVEYWQHRLDRCGVPFVASHRMGEDVLAFDDPDGMQLELIANHADLRVTPWAASDIPAVHALRGFLGSTLTVREAAPTASVLQKMGYREIGSEGMRRRFTAEIAYDTGLVTDKRPANTAAALAPGARIDLVLAPGGRPGRLGAGTVHHIAFRVPDDEAQRSWRATLEKHPLAVTQVLDRSYFHSIYFREPGGVLFELATDPPGFNADEPRESLGEALKLPPWLEPRRASLEKILPALVMRQPTTAPLADLSDSVTGLDE